MGTGAQEEGITVSFRSDGAPLRVKRLVSALVPAALLMSACSSGDGVPRSTRITIGGFDFSESTILANIYAGALTARGYHVELRPNLGAREVVMPAVERGDIDVYAGYAATELEFLDGGAGEASADIGETVKKLRSRLEPRGLTALDAALAVNTNAFAVTRSTAERYGLTKISDLAPVADELVLGGPAECPSRPFCLPGLERTYGLHFKAFVALDAGGPLSKDALESGAVDVALVFSSDGTVPRRSLVVLDDDKRLQRADNIVPVVRRSLATGSVAATLNKVSRQLTTEDLGAMNARADDEDPAALAEAWLQKHGFATAGATKRS
jgi:osmoprotectant transport system substrate-binding protein